MLFFLFLPFVKLASGCGWDVVGTCGLGEEGALSLQSFSLQRPTVLVIGKQMTLWLCY